MEDKKQILIVDDSPNEIRVLMENLKSDFAVAVATSGEAALKTVETTAPELVLMDVTMEPMDGYETCSKLLEKYPNLPVIFVSANTQTEEILKGFDVGGQDYITKPIDSAVLKNKVKLVLEQIDAGRQLKTEKNEVSELAMAAMSSAGDLSIVLNFVRSASKLHESRELAEDLVRAIKEYGLNTTAQIRGAGGQFVEASNTGEIVPLESNILSSSVNVKGRILQKAQRLIVVYETVSLLIKNMPTEDEKRTGELRDYLMILAENAHDLNQKIKTDKIIADQRIAMVLEAVKDANDTLSDIQSFQKQYKEDSLRIMDELMEEVEANFFSMGLTEGQEKMITDMIQKKLNEGVNHMEEGLHIDEKMHRLTENLSELTRNL